jgi:hypothetical protein
VFILDLSCESKINNFSFKLIIRIYENIVKLNVSMTDIPLMDEIKSFHHLVYNFSANRLRQVPSRNKERGVLKVSKNRIEHFPLTVLNNKVKLSVMVNGIVKFHNAILSCVKLRFLFILYRFDVFTLRLALSRNIFQQFYFSLNCLENVGILTQFLLVVYFYSYNESSRFMDTLSH